MTRDERHRRHLARLIQRFARTIGVGMSRPACSKGCGRPARYVPPYRGTAPLCLTCHLTAVRGRTERNRVRRLAVRAAAPKVPTDLSPDAIEQRYRVALAQIRRTEVGTR